MSTHITMFNPSQGRNSIPSKSVRLLAFGGSPPHSSQSPLGSPPDPASPLVLLHPTYPSPPPSSSTPQSHIYIEVVPTRHGYVSPGGSTQFTEIKTEPALFSPTNSTASQSSFTSAQSYEPLNPAGAQFYSQTVSTSANPSASSAIISPFQGLEVDRKNKKGPTSRPQEELCLVCGDRASGYHYNALACEGCKGFFRRSITKNARYTNTCKYGGNCEIDMYMRRKCQECRFRKCTAVGMRQECVVPESQCAIKRSNKKPVARVVKTASSPSGAASLFGTPEKRTRPFRPLKPEEGQLIDLIVALQAQYELPSEEELKKIDTMVMLEENKKHAVIRTMCETTIRVIELIVEFCKRLPGFNSLRMDDQVLLLKSSSSEIMMLRTARRYDPTSDQIIFANNQPYDRDQFSTVGNNSHELFNFCKAMSDMEVDNAEYALIAALIIFSERHNLKEPSKVERIQEIYVEALEAYVYNKRPRESVMFAKLLNILCVVKDLARKNEEFSYSLMLNDSKFPQILKEMWYE